MARKIISLDLLENALQKSWSSETSSDPSNWSRDNVAWGQCAITALIVQDYFGGRLLRTIAKLPNGTSVSHYYNMLENGSIVDLTKRQFLDGTTFATPEERSREYVLSYPATAKRYEMLKSRVEDVMSKPIFYLANPTVDRINVRKIEMQLEEELNIELYNPFYDRYRRGIILLDLGLRKPYTDTKRMDENLVEKDLEDIKACDGLVAIIGKNADRLIGVSMEVFYNSTLGHPTYLIIEDESIYNHPWFAKFATARFRSIEEFKDWYTRDKRIEKLAGINPKKEKL